MELTAADRAGILKQHTAKPADSIREDKKAIILFVEVFMLTIL